MKFYFLRAACVVLGCMCIAALATYATPALRGSGVTYLIAWAGLVLIVMPLIPGRRP